MATVLKTVPVALECSSRFLSIVNADANITSVLQIVTVDDGVNLSLTFSLALTAGEVTALDAIVAAWDNSLCGFESVYEDVTMNGMSHQLQFGESGTAKNEWLECYGDAKYSNQSPAVMPFKSKLVGMTFSNKKESADTDIRIYSTPNGGAETPKTLDYTWSIVNRRTAFKSDFNADIVFDAGDKIAIYLVDTGTDPQNVNVIMYFVAVDDATTEGGETWSGDFSTGTGGGSS